ncbi:MAG: hypothetical protein JXQ73_10110 [Phycisphaerae bacterium]|nr:hypothetical protein [Phycisphaerae bacterium]
MSSMLVKCLTLMSMVVMLTGVCSQCETDPIVEMDQPTAALNAGTVTVTVQGQEGYCTNQPPYDSYYLYAKLLHWSGGVPVNHPEIGPYGWTRVGPYPCSGGVFVKRSYYDFTISFDVPGSSGDTFAVQVRSNEGEGFDPFTVVSPQVTVE